MNAAAHPSPSANLAFPISTHKLFTYNRLDWGTLWSGILRKIPLKPLKCTLNHCMYEVHDPRDMKFICLYEDSNQDFMRDRHIPYSVGHTSANNRLSYQTNIAVFAGWYEAIWTRNTKYWLWFKEQSWSVLARSSKYCFIFLSS